ncbi:receptor-type tyrosine-protein phosphatase mu-like isoform X2 [Argopecten irradians]|uniref:receptor-type tyrosine-protein phosphatase mu-like isoform X2 n=1 Tax=Argopecten irradians TaxID=31199 RepID=UPI003718F0F7
MFCFLGCIDGAFGSSCSKTCGNCEDMRCSLDTGDCDTPCLTGWTGQRCDVKVKKQSQSQNEDSNIGIYAGGAVGGVVVLSLLVIVIVCVIKRKSSGNSSVPSAVYGQSKSSNLTNRHTDGGQVYINLQNGYMPEEREGLDNVYCNEGPVGFLINTLKTAIAEKARDDEQKFTAEFESFPLGSMHPHTAAEKNKSKNRFKAIYPYDHSRVPLDSVSGGNDSDYINANYIDSVEERRVYVATQGPLPTTINDFWRMIWAINSGKIVMLTNLVESRKDKCAKYWPDEGDPMSTKTFHITLNRERRYASHVVRNLTVVYKKSKESREINQFHFTTWPDHGTPNTLELVLFHRRIKLCQTSLPGQLVIHCSAGIGRTGTFIALDALLDFGRKYQRIDIRHYVNTMRKDRMNMIQTQEQYVALHELLAEAFDLQDTLIPKSMFLSKYHVLSSTSQPQNQTQLRDEFQLMQNLKPTYKLEQDYMASTLPENKAKNITMRILAADRFRAFLKSYSATGNDYVNAVITQSYTDRQGYIVTQSPLPGTRADLWTLVMDYQCDTMVILGDNKNPEQDTPWIPLETSNIEIGDFKVQQRGNPTEFNGVDVTEISISKQNVKAPHSMKVFRLKEWTMDRQVPPSKQSVLHLLEQVESRRRASGNKPVLVSCRDGATQCGLFCLMANTRDQIKMDEEVDVFQAARQLLVRRPEFLSTLEQYQYCYAILNDYLEATDVYIN